MCECILDTVFLIADSFQHIQLGFFHLFIIGSISFPAIKSKTLFSHLRRTVKSFFHGKKSEEIFWIINHAWNLLSFNGQIETQSAAAAAKSSFKNFNHLKKQKLPKF